MTDSKIWSNQTLNWNEVFVSTMTMIALLYASTAFQFQHPRLNLCTKNLKISTPKIASDAVLAGVMSGGSL